ncbi:hypothetical protein Tco_0942119 [Tanacetum coccineum]
MGNVIKSVAERTHHQRQYDRRVNKRQMQPHESKIDTGKAVEADLVVTESSGTKSEVKYDSIRLGNDTYADDADIRPIYDEEPMAEVGLTITQHYLPKRRESTFAKPDHMITSSESRNSSKNMPRFSSNDMVHNHYLDEARKKTQERYRNSKTSVMPSARFQSTANGSKPKPRSTNHSTRSLPESKSSCVTITAVPKADHSKSSSSFLHSKHFVCSTCHKCVFSANHDACITKLLKEVNSRAKIQSYKTRNSNKPIDQKSHTQKPGRKIFIGHRWIVGLRWIPTRKLFDSCTSKVDSEPPYGSKVDIPNFHECKQILDVSAELESLFGHLFDKYFNGENQVVSKSSAVTTAEVSDKCQQQQDSTSSTSTLATTITADGHFNV